MRVFIFILISFSLYAKVLKLGTENWPPFSFYDKHHKVSGFSTEVIENTCKMMNVKIASIEILPWVRTQQLAFLGKFDGAYTASINKERKKYMYFPKEDIVESKWVLFASNKNLKFNSLKDLKGKTICVIKGYNYPKKFKEYIQHNSYLTYTSTEILNIKKLIFKRCDYMPAVLETTIFLTKHNPQLTQINAYKKLFYFKKPIASTKFYIMFSKKRVSKEFVDKFSTTLKKFKQTQKYKKLVKKYLR